jgi:transcription antitermination factor NusG
MPTAIAIPSWYALTVHPKHEHLAQRSLANHDFETYLPMHRVRRRWSDRSKDQEVVLFPGYLFGRFAMYQKIRVLTSPSVRSIVSVGRDPLQVSETEIESIRALVASGRPVDVCPYLRIGQPVRITQGPMASLRGIVTRTSDSWRVVVAVEALGCSVAVEVDADQLSPDHIASEHSNEFLTLARKSVERQFSAGLSPAHSRIT